MMLSLLLLLLALSSASPQDMKKPSEDRNVTSLNPDLEDRAREMTDISVNTSVYQHLLFPSKMKQKRQALDTGNVKWQTWNGSLPDKAVSIDNTYVGRTDYVCKHGCHAGFYSSSLGDFCHYPHANKEHRTDSFDILVNEYNIEILEWKEGSYGSVPEHAVRTCSSEEVYVGKNKYGLGKVHPSSRAFYLPWKGTQYWYYYYEVLTINRGIEREIISDVMYKTNDAKIIAYPPETLHILSVTNRRSYPVTETVTFSEKVINEKRWDVRASLSVDVSSTFTGNVPFIASAKIRIGGHLTFDYSNGATHAEEVSHTVELPVSVPPRHLCEIKILAYKYDANIPFIALLTRAYKNKEVTHSFVPGTYQSIHTREVRAVIERCDNATSTQPRPRKRLIQINS